MYEERYGTGWDDLGVEAAIERAYALGVLAGLGEGLPGEYDRVKAAVDTGPGADMVELAYEEGQQAVADVDVRDRSEEEAWTDLVEDADGRLTRGGAEGGDGNGNEDDEAASAPPSSLSALEPPDDDPGMLDFPSFLRRNRE